MKSPVLVGVCAVSLVCSLLALALAWPNAEPRLELQTSPTATELAQLRAEIADLQRQMEFAPASTTGTVGDRGNALALDPHAPPTERTAMDPREYLAHYVLSFADDGQGSEYYRLAVEAHVVPLCLPIAELVRDPRRPTSLRQSLATMLGRRRFQDVAEVTEALLAAVRPPNETALAQAALAALSRVASRHAIPGLQALVLQCSEPVRAQALALLVELTGDGANAILLQLYLQARDDVLRQAVVRALTGADGGPALELLTAASGSDTPIRLAAAQKVAEFDEPGFDALVDRWRPRETDAGVLAALGAASGTIAGWSPAQATGAPNAEASRDDPNAWAPRSPEMGLQWLQLSYATAVRATAVRIFEVNAPGAVVEVLGRGADGDWFTLWRGNPVVGPSPLVLTFAQTSVPIRTIRLRLDTDRTTGWNEIDAVELVGPDGAQWASRATASSTFASQGQGNLHGTEAEALNFIKTSRRR